MLPLTLGAVAIALDFEASVGKPLGGSACEPLPRWHFEIQVRLTRLRLKGSLRKITPSGLGKEVDFKYEKSPNKCRAFDSLDSALYFTGT